MRTFSLLALAACSAPAPVHAVEPAPPAARTVDVVDREFGLAVADPYRWMEGDDNPERDAWLRAQGERTDRLLAQLPGRDRMRARVRELGNGVTAVFDVQLGGGRMFYRELAAGEQLAKLEVRERGAERVLVDPATLGTATAHASLEAYAVSPDGARVAYVIASGGGELGVLHVIDVATGKDLPDRLERMWGERAVSWLPDGKSFFYTQLAASRPGVDPMFDQVVRYHELGKPDDPIVLSHEQGGALPVTAEEWPGVYVQADTGYAIAGIGGAHSEQRLAIVKLADLDRTGGGKTPWRMLAEYADGVEAAFVHGDRVYLETYKNAPNRKIVSMPADHPDVASARVDIAEAPDATLANWVTAKDALYVLHNAGGRARMMRRPWDGKAATPIALPGDGWVPDVASDPRADGVVFQLETWVSPGVYYVFDGTRSVPAGIASKTTADASFVVADEVEAIGADGARVPLSILHTKDVAYDGARPTLIDAYGAYGVTAYPWFSATRLAWLERGGVFAIAHVRGGGEKGRRWQDDGSRDKKLNGIYDLIACASYLIDHRLTSPAKLAIWGGSMGGVLIGRTLTERPDLFAAAVIGSGIVNPLRILHAANGANQKVELGDPATEGGYRSILAIDPYEHVAPNTAYPAVLFTVGLNDHRVAPWMTAKLAARLLAATTSGRPVAIRIDADAGHGIGSTRDQSLAERADIYSFVLSAFGAAR